jgi:hypothetical protein
MAKRKKKKGSEVALSSPSTYDDSKWRARSDYDTLCSAAEISRDGARMRNAKAHAREQKVKAERIARLDGKIL